MSRLPPLPNLRFDEGGLIYGDDFGDSYFSRDDGLAETRAVYLGGNHLPHAWQGKPKFVIGELGFGTGLNILAAWALWADTAPPDATLHIITVEGFLMDAEMARLAHAAWPELSHLSEKLLSRWPTRACGVQRIWFEEARIAITFLIGSCEDVLSRMDFQADCWFLDGFAPAKNPQMWSPQVFAHIARLSKQGTTIATYSVAGAVRAGLQGVGFEVARVPGFGSKRERLEGRFSNNGPAPAVSSQTSEAKTLDPAVIAHNTNEVPAFAGMTPPLGTSTPPQTAIVIGGGIGGAAMCAALARRGVTAELIDPDPCARTKASGNPAALIMPRLDKADTREARFYRSAYLMACDAYREMPSECFEQTGVIEYGEDDDAKARLADLSADPPFPSDVLGVGDDGTVTHMTGGIAYPDAVLAHLKGQATRHPVPVERFVQVDGQWCAYGAQDTLIAGADICVIAAGTGVSALCDLGTELGGRAGQLSLAKVTGDIPAQPLSGGGYAMPFHDFLSFGATYDRWPITNPHPPAVSDAGHAHNQALLTQFVPELATRIDMTTCTGRTSIRVTTNDHLPIAGSVPNAPQGLYVLAGLGSRGFTTAFLCAETIVSDAFGEPAPMEVEVRAAIAPDRFFKRAAKKRR